MPDQLKPEVQAPVLVDPINALRAQIKEAVKNDRTFRAMQRIERLGIVWSLNVGIPAPGIKGPDGGEPIIEYFAEIRRGPYEGLAAKSPFPYEALDALVGMIEAKKLEEVPAYAR